MLVGGTDLIGPRSDFAGFAQKKIPFLFFSHATHKDYHGAGDRPELLDYPVMATDAEVIKQIALDIARSPKNPIYLETPVYATREVNTLLQIIRQIKLERPDLPMAYRLAFDDLEERLRTDHSPAPLTLAA